MYNTIYVEGDSAVIVCGAHKVVVDVQDLPFLSPLRWTTLQPSKYSKTRYATTTLNGHTTYMHRFLTGAPGGTHVDHQNHDGLDNRRDNLVVTTPTLNSSRRQGPNRNSTSGALGVSAHKSASGKWTWEARVQLGERIRCKNFPLNPEGLEQAAAWAAEVRSQR